MQAAVDFIARCIAGKCAEASKEALNDLGGVKFVQLTEEEYKNLEIKDPTTFYLVTKNSKIILYLGETNVITSKISGQAYFNSKAIQTINTNSVAVSNAYTCINGIATLSEI